MYLTGPVVSDDFVNPIKRLSEAGFYDGSGVRGPSLLLGEGIRGSVRLGKE